MVKGYKPGELGTESKPVKTKGCLIAFGLFVLFAILVSSCAKPEPKDSALSAYIISQQFVEEKLRSPSTAKFPMFREAHVTNIGEGKYIVIAYVDAQNHFGATIRNNFSATVKYAGDNSWVCEALNMWE